MDELEIGLRIKLFGALNLPLNYRGGKKNLTPDFSWIINSEPDVGKIESFTQSILGNNPTDLTFTQTGPPSFNDIRAFLSVHSNI